MGSEHVADLLAHVVRPEDDPLWTYRGIERPRDAARSQSLVAADPRRTATSLTFAVSRGPGGAHGLSSSYGRPDLGAGSLEVAGVLFSRAVQRTPVSTEATHLLLRHAFDDLGYRRVEWKCDSLNEPSRRRGPRLGFTHEGRFRQHMTVKGRNRDTDWFAVTDAEWPAVRRAHETWLDPANHDAEGRQRVALGALTRPSPP